MSFELNRRLTAKRAPLATSANVDPVTASIIRGSFETTCYEVGMKLARSATSAIINQSSEISISTLDAHARLAGVSLGAPQLLFIAPLSARYALEFFEADDWGPGDVFVGNDPDYGGGHLPDYNVFAPIFDKSGKLVLIQALQAHQGDTGGKDPGGFTLEATDIFTEGLAIPSLKLVHRGQKRRDVIKLLERNNRFPSFAGDLAAMIGAVQYSAKLHGELLDHWGYETVAAAINYNIDHSERRFREEVSKWKDGVYEGDVLIDHDTQGVKDVRVHVKCVVEGDQLTLDFTGSDDRPELTGVWNSYSNSRGYAVAQLASMIDPSIVKNEGLFNAVNLIIPENTILQPPDNKPVALGSFHPAVEIAEAICVALADVVPDRTCPQVYKIGMPNAVIGFDEKGHMWLDQGVDARAMDSSAVKGIDGWGTSCVGLGNLLLSEAEDAEARHPIINISREMTIDSGGVGQWRGQPGSLNVKKVLEPVSAMAWMVSAAHPLRGLCGGGDGGAYSNDFEVGTPNEYRVDLAVNARLPPGAVMAYQHGGGGGFGAALLRDPEAVKEDVLDEKVSAAAARDRYGVVLTGTLDDYDLAVDLAATQSLRRQLSAAHAA
jgi:N-methylhydantoinase B